MEYKHLRLLAEKYPNIRTAMGEMVHLETLLSLPKETEYFFSDLHGEDKAFIHLLRSASGTIRNKIRILFENNLTVEQQNQLANLIYDPERVLDMMERDGRLTDEWVRITINRLVELLRFTSSKYPRSRVREKMPEEHAKVIEELLYVTYDDEDRGIYNQAIVQAILRSNATFDFVVSLCEMVQNISVDTLHIIGDIFDRGPGPHHIMEELMRFPKVDIQWGNHDVVWMGAAAGCDACMLNVLRVALRYNGFDCIEDGYGINLRPLYSLSQKLYGNDPCKIFMPKILDENVYDQVDPEIAAKMHKAISIMQFKAEGQLLKRHPEYGFDERNVLEKVDYKKMVYKEDGKEYPLLDTNFPTIDPKDPLKFSPEEEELMISIRASFAHGEALHRHMNYIFEVGSTYKCHNNNLLFHGCLPMDEKGNFTEMTVRPGEAFSGKRLMDELFYEIRRAWYSPSGSPEKQRAADLLWYLWCGPNSPMFGKSKMATFENYFIADKAVRKEHYNPYYQVSQKEEIADKILEEFGLNPEKAHIINGHVPVKLKDGETPIKANGKLFVIDGGIAKAYQAKTGIAGYTMIFNSHYLALVEHKSFAKIEKDTGSYAPEIQVIERMPKRLRVAHTSYGERIVQRIEDLEELVKAYRQGWIPEVLDPRVGNPCAE